MRAAIVLGCLQLLVLVHVACGFQYWNYCFLSNNVVGGNGGSEFYFLSAWGMTVKTIRVWTGKEAGKVMLKSIELETFDGYKWNVGAAYGASTDFDFQPGETLSGDVTIGGNGIGTRAGYLHFKTSNGREFSVGELHTPYTTNADGGFLVGAFGHGGSDIDALGLIFSHRVTSAKMTNLQYPTLSEVMLSKVPSSVFERTCCNDGDYWEPVQTYTYTQEEGQTTTWSLSSTLVVGGGLSVEGSVPLLGKATAEVHWELSATASYVNQESTIKTTSYTQSIQCGPHERQVFRSTQSKASVSLPYTADLLVTFGNGQTFNFAQSGTFQGVSAISFYDSNTHIPLDNSTKCV